MKNKTILLVDDDPDDRDVFAAGFREIDPDTECMFASGPEQAMEVLGGMTILPDCIVTDYNMPSTNGSQFVTLLKAHETFRVIPVVVYSTAKPPEDLLKAGAWKMVVKPSTYTGLLTILGKLLAELQ